MGYYEAIEDGIKIEEGKRCNKYIVPCHKCGGEVISYNYLRGRKYTCNMCKLKQKTTEEKTRTKIQKTKKERKLNEAIRRISNITNIGKYDDAIEKVKSKLDRRGWFDSTEEIMVALELIRKKVKARHQVKLGRYRADFVLPNEKIVLEVDGVLFHDERTTGKEQLRDSLICLALGAEWEVIRISDVYINENITKLVPAIKKLKERRQAQRKLNNGQLVDNYTRIRT
jgi:very-short-patch-repair endonuclease